MAYDPQAHVRVCVLVVRNFPFHQVILSHTCTRKQPIPCHSAPRFNIHCMQDFERGPERRAQAPKDQTSRSWLGRLGRQRRTRPNPFFRFSWSKDPDPTLVESPTGKLKDPSNAPIRRSVPGMQLWAHLLALVISLEPRSKKSWVTSGNRLGCRCFPCRGIASHLCCHHPIYAFG